MSTAVMTRRAFDTRGNLADHLFRCLETPYSDVLEHNTVPATKWNGPRMRIRGPFSCCKLSLVGPDIRSGRTYSADRIVPKFGEQ